ncbi:enoyl-CoA hydratase/isomerase family protein [Paraburkholderia panacisoli]|uniref:Enoyl-CoA hydratase/isomerase family protein n=1 Tax=Paraburkholderia panacisoli TaxID=2603818 RepID=A0A5B0GED4_9BURK|nr:enoyl-CoA hydratase/isomerase family protein [Paraburkholderia panacisoli]KAA1001733.1 enoyl-CoA hydratase/isomerase family protein [Paraburkholderia panacisoli]
MQRNITLTSREDLAVITLGNEAQANAIDLQVCTDLLNALADIEADGRYRAVVLRSTGRIFSAGGNLVQILEGLQRSDGFLEALISLLNDLILKLRRLPIPVIASVQGLRQVQVFRWLWRATWLSSHVRLNLSSGTASWAPRPTGDFPSIWRGA